MLKAQELPGLANFDIEASWAQVALVGGEHGLTVPTLFLDDDAGSLRASYDAVRSRLEVRRNHAVVTRGGYTPGIAIGVPEGYRMGTTAVEILKGEIAARGIRAHFLRAAVSSGTINLGSSHFGSLNVAGDRGSIGFEEVTVEGAVQGRLREGSITIAKSLATDWFLAAPLGTVTTREVEGNVYANALQRIHE